uniref:Uncharacterized protein LOC116956682 isoform X2 n=1 Tax=Petromyzon marinus TaxID=7757 RepID=A0AAJ7UEM8_PETMA|nr:uncharacterized protein LOC116956682 isoform X2 [Petromyzon marinus]
MDATPLVQRACRNRLGLRAGLRLSGRCGARHQHPVAMQGLLRLDAPGDMQVNGGLDCPTQHAAAVTLARTSGLRNEQIKIKEIYNKITNCPCNFGVEFGWVTLLGPIVIFFVLLSIIASDACRARCGHSKGKRLLRYSALTIVASVAWGSVALLNSEAVCCIQGGYPSDSPCLVGRNATANAVRYEDCTSDSEVAGVRLLMYGGSIFSVILAFIAITFGLKWLLKKQNVPNQSEVP